MKAIISYNGFSSWSIKKTRECKKLIIKLWKLQKNFWLGKNMGRAAHLHWAPLQDLETVLQLPSLNLIPWIHVEKNCKTVQNNAKLWLLIFEYCKIHFSFPWNRYSFFFLLYGSLVFKAIYVAFIFWISVYLNSINKEKFSTAAFCSCQMGIFSYYVCARVCVCERARVYGTYMCSFIDTNFHTRFHFFVWVGSPVLQIGYSWILC